MALPFFVAPGMGLAPGSAGPGGKSRPISFGQGGLALAPSRKDQSLITTILAAETLRAGSSPDPAGPGARSRQRLSLLWRLSAGVLLGAVGFLGITLYEQLYAKVDRLSETLVKKEEFSASRTGLWDRITRQCQKGEAAATELRQRCARLEAEAEGISVRKKELGPEVVRLRDKLRGYVRQGSVSLYHQARQQAEERRQLLAEVRRLRERLAAAEAEEPTGGGQ